MCSDSRTREEIVAFRELHMVVHAGIAYLHTKTSIRALDRVAYLPLVRKKKTLVAKTDDIEKRIVKTQGPDQDEARQTLERELNEMKKQTTDVVKSMQECFLWERPLVPQSQRRQPVPAID